MTEHKAIGPGLAFSVHLHLMARDDAPDAPHLQNVSSKSLSNPILP